MSKLDAYLDGLGLGAAPAEPAPAAASTIDYDAIASKVADKIATATAVPATQLPPASDAGAPLATSAGRTDMTDILNWTEEDYERQFRLKAKVPHRPHDVRNREFYRAIRMQAEASMSRVKVQLGPRKNRG